MDFLENYIAMAPLTGEKFTTDSADVYTYLVNFISGNETTDANIQAHDKDNKGLLDTKYLRGR